MRKNLILKIDVDTERGTRIGVNNLLALFNKLNIPATFLFSLGPDNTGRALKRVFRPGFLTKVSRTSVVSTYGVKTLLNGVLWPGPRIAKKHAPLLRRTRDAGHEVGIHSYDHCYWQDYVHKISKKRVFEEFQKARDVFKCVFGFEARSAGSAGWQANANSLAAYDHANLLYGSDCRGSTPFIPKINGEVFHTPQFPTTLPTLDELLGRPEYPIESLSDLLLDQLSEKAPNVFTMHAELEGMRYLEWFESFLRKALSQGVEFERLEDVAKATIAEQELPVCEFIQSTVDGRSGELAVQQ
ncbi:MAG: polysaccharide deacetylase family protein [Gammaproteobacteria bacterium]